jgi:hypothetical protein
LLTNRWLLIQQYVNKAASTIRAGLKEPAKKKLEQQGKFAYNRAVWQAGVQGEKEAVGTGMH